MWKLLASLVLFTAVAAQQFNHAEPSAEMHKQHWNADGLWSQIRMASELVSLAKDQVTFEVQNMRRRQQPVDQPAQGQRGHVTLATFDGAEGTTYSWRDTNDPVMGGQSHSSFEVEGSEGHFKGTCAIVPFLKAPGFCKATTQHSFFGPAPHFADASPFINGALYLDVETTTPGYEGFKVAFGAKNAKRPPGSMHFGSPTFKAGFSVPSEHRTTVKVPFKDFSVDWSDYTGRCDTKDPKSGFQHRCCSSEHPEVCPGAQHLAEITSLELWAEGAAGDFDLKVFSIGAGPLESQQPTMML